MAWSGVGLVGGVCGLGGWCVWAHLFIVTALLFVLLKKSACSAYRYTTPSLH